MLGDRRRARLETSITMEGEVPLPHLVVAIRACVCERMGRHHQRVAPVQLRPAVGRRVGLRDLCRRVVVRCDGVSCVRVRREDDDPEDEASARVA